MAGWLDTLRRQVVGANAADLRPLGPGLDAAAGWLARAQDATPDDGVAALYDLRGRRWAASYPETTGYIIPTLYTYAERSGRGEFAARANRMAHWESDIQLPGGGVMAGHYDAAQVVPTIFNTGQVLFGWAAAYRHSGEPRFADSARAAADWLLAAQDADGAWRRYGSPFAHAGLNVYNTRVAYGLVEIGQLLDEPRYVEAGCANVDWALGQVRDNGWFDHNDLEDDRRPLTHTIAYAIRGVLEVGLRTDNSRYIDQARRSAAAVAATRREDGALPGRLDADWRAAAPWSCLTGNVQMAYIWLRLQELETDTAADWQGSARDGIAFLQARQALAHSDAGVRGAIAGSAPVNGHYMRRACPNWAAKFYMDAVMRYAAQLG